MGNLENTNAEVLQCFWDGGFVARRTETLWAGLACNLTIEQVGDRNIALAFTSLNEKKRIDLVKDAWKMKGSTATM